MEDLYFNLAKEEFSKSRKILIWVFAILVALLAIWDTYLEFFKHDTSVVIGLTVTLYVITVFLFTIAILASKKKKEHFFKVDKENISYHYGLFFPKHHNYNWDEIGKIFVPPHSKNVTLMLKNRTVTHVNLNWVEKNKARLIRRHIFYSAKSKGVEIAKTKYKK